MLVDEPCLLACLLAYLFVLVLVILLGVNHGFAVATVKARALG